MHLYALIAQRSNGEEWILSRGKKMKKVIEIHAAEGGEDSSLFVRDLAQAYVKTFQRIG